MLCGQKIKDGGSYLKDVEMVCLGDFGYHNFFRGEWRITHLKSGLCVHTFDNEREAKSFCKQIYLNAKKKWSPKIDDVLTYMDMKEEMQEILDEFLGKEEVEDPSPYTYDTDDDIPF